MELTKQESIKIKGVAILAMLMLHLFCRLDNLPYSPFIYIGNIPLVYYLGLFGDICVPIYCFSSGYAHALLKEKHKDNYIKTLPKKALSFLCNYWIVLLIFCAVGLISGNTADIPTSFTSFLGNFFLYRLSYNGAWWFVLTYLFLLALSPLLLSLIRKIPIFITLMISALIYCASYYFRFNYILNIPNAVLAWIWGQMILIGTSQFSYIFGLICYERKWISKLRMYLQKENCQSTTNVKLMRFAKITIYFLPIVTFLIHCVFQTMAFAPISAAAVLMFIFAVRLPMLLERAFLFLGKHSTNIWLIHMFFYFTLFENLVFVAKYPILILALMLIICVASSSVIQYLNRKFNVLLNISK